MKNLRLTPKLFQYTELTLAPPAIGNKGSVNPKTQRLSFQALTNFHVYDRSSGVKEVARASVQYTYVSNRILEGIESLVNRILNVKNTDNQYIKDNSNKDDIMLYRNLVLIYCSCSAFKKTLIILKKVLYFISVFTIISCQSEIDKIKNSDSIEECIENVTQHINLCFEGSNQIDVDEKADYDFESNILTVYKGKSTTDYFQKWEICIFSQTLK